MVLCIDFGGDWFCVLIFGGVIILFCVFQMWFILNDF